MISAKTDKTTDQTKVEIKGHRLILAAELIAIVDSVSRVIFKESDKDRVEFLKDLPDLVLGMDAKIKATRFPFSPEQLKKMIEESDNEI